MPRRAAKVDANQAQIVAALRSVGASVQHLHNVAGGCPDLCVGWAGKNYLLEVKDGNKVRSARGLTPAQEVWFAEWRGQAAVVEDVKQALEAIGIPFRGYIS